MEPFDETPKEYNQKVIDHILEQFDIINIPDPLPAVPDIKNFVNVVAAANKVVPEIQNISSGFDIITTYDDPTLKSALYSLGSSLFKWTLKGDIPDENIMSAKTLLEYAVQLDPAYHEAYNRLGDCWMRIMDGFEKAICCFKGALTYMKQKAEASEYAFDAHYNNFKGDNYFKIGICFIKLNRKSDAELFLTLARDIVSTEYSGFTEIGFKSWDQVFALLNRM